MALIAHSLAVATAARWFARSRRMKGSCHTCRFDECITCNECSAHGRDTTTHVKGRGG